jgi:hypothetical protein
MGCAAGGVGHRAPEGSGQAHPCISLNVVTESKRIIRSRPETVALSDRLQPAY